MTDINTVLCPIDFSEPSLHALEHAAAIARWYEARLVGLHAHSKIFASAHDVIVAGHAGAPLTESLTFDQSRTELDHMMTAARSSGIIAETRAVTGEPADVILQTASALPADLLVMGTHGLTGFEHLVLGSVTEKVLRKARCPVMSVPPRAQRTSKLPFKRIVCTVDFSDPSLAALSFGCSIAQECDAELTILHVLENEDVEPLTDRPITVPEYWQYRREEAADKLARLMPDGANSWCTAQTRLERGKPYRKILEVAAEAETDLIVMGVHGRNALDMMVFGSTANQVVRRATCPVLTLRS